MTNTFHKPDTFSVYLSLFYKNVFCLVLFLLVFTLPGKSEITVLLVPSYGQVSMGIGSSSYAPSWNFYGAAPDFTTSFTLPANFTACESFSVVSAAKVNGKTSCNAYADRASSSGVYRMSVYGDVVPNSNVRVKINADFSITWSGTNVENTAGFNFYASAGDNVGAQVSRGSSTSFSGTLHNNDLWTAVVIPPSDKAYTSGGKTYYFLGTVESNGKGAIYEGSTSTEYSSLVNSVTAKYIGKALTKVAGTDEQIGRVNKSLPKLLGVKVWDEESGALVTNAPVTFSVAEPKNGGKFSDGSQTIVVYTNSAGLASTEFILGGSTGTYKINASCPVNVCTSGATTVTFSAEAKGTKLTCVDCELHGKVSALMRNSFRVRVVDTVDGSASAGAAVTYDLIRFEDKNGNSSGDYHGGSIPFVFDPVTDQNGFSRAKLRLGSEEGTYVIRARCESCAEGQEAIAYGVAHSYNVTPEVEKVLSADPGANEDDCPSGCCPRTPVVRAQMVPNKNGNKSFTSAKGENVVSLNTQVLPACLGNNSNVTWEVADAPGDYIYSGTPTQPASKQTTNFTVGSGDFPKAETGRPLPLAYKATAKVMRGNTPYYAAVLVRQDEIDKCRQEYFDLSKLGTDLTSDEYLPRYDRTRFTIGVDGAIDPDYVRFIDCYAHIFPERAREVESLRTNSAINFPIDVKSGYRSPRKNYLQSPKGVWNSSHQFGDAVDIVPQNLTPQNRAERFKALWDNTSCPKILETDGAKVMAFCKNVGDSISYNGKYDESNMFGLANCLHLGK